MILNELQLEGLRQRATEMRRFLAVGDDLPIANDLFTLLEKKDIILCEYAFSSNAESNVDATITYFLTDKKKYTFIGLNTANYFDKQLFCIAHELYHYITETGKAYDSGLSQDDEETEILADRFAAELLLPQSTLRSLLIREYKTTNLEKITKKRLLRFIARLQCVWWLPYRSLVKRLHEEEAITDEQYFDLYAMNERNMDGEYSRLCLAIDKETYLRLNNPTNRIGTSPRALEVIIKNFEDSIINEDAFVSILEQFGKKPSDFGFDLIVSSEDVEEFETFFSGGTSYEN